MTTFAAKEQEYMNQTEQGPNVESILKAIRSLPEKDLLYLLSKLFEQSPMLSPSLNSFVWENKFTDGVVCPYCGKKHVRRNGHRKDGAQKYMCAEYGKSFVARTNTITAGSRKPLEIWKKYIDCMVNDQPIRKAAEECGMAASTSFAWRHKILDVLRSMSEGVT